MPKITFVEFDGSKHSVEVEAGVSVMEAARDGNVPGIEAECGGACACATCHVYIDDEWLAITGPAGETERELLALVEDFAESSRLSCQIDITDAMDGLIVRRSEEHTSELQSLMRSSYTVFCFKKKNKTN